MREEQGDEAFAPELPPVEAGGYLIVYLFEVGPAAAGVAGAIPVPYKELLAWQEGIGLTLNPWEFRTLRLLSAEYVVESKLAEKKDRPAPWVNPDSEEHKAKILPGRIKSFLRE